MSVGKKIELSIIQLAQKAHTAGIHLIISTQYPTSKVITDVIKTNFPSRMAFRVNSQTDSRTILGSPDAKRLLRSGDLFFTSEGDITRVQCAFIDFTEIDEITRFIGNQRGYATSYLLPEYSEDAGSEPQDVYLRNKDILFEDSARLIVNHQQGSSSLIQRKFAIGYNRVGRIMDQLEAAGIVGPSEGSKNRQVHFTDLFSLEKYLEKLAKGE